MDAKKHINIKLFATLKKFASDFPEKYPVLPGTSVRSLLEEIGVPADKAKLIFIDGVKKDPTYILQGGERVGIFPPVGGG